MNWINAKDKLPEHEALCMIYIEELSIMTPAYFDKVDPYSFNVPTRLTCCCGRTFVLIKYNIFWMPIDSIPKPEMK